MFKGNRNLAVGIFFSVALASLAGFSAWLAGTKGNQDMTSYSMLFESDVSGLSLGGPVYYLGVSVGSVTAMTLVPGPKVTVRVDISILTDTPIDSGSYASLNAQGITGVTVINIAGEPGDHLPLQKSDDGDYPHLPVRQTGLSALLSSAPVTIGKINQVLDRASVWLGEENRQSVTNLLLHIEALMSSLAAERDTFASLPGELSTFLSDARSTVGRLKALVETVQPDVAAALANINAASHSLATVTDRIDNWLLENEAELQHFMDNGLGQAPDLIYDLRNTLREAEKLIQQLQEDPSQLIHRSPDNALEVEP